MTRTLLAALLYFTLVFAAGFALGTIRTLWLAPALGELGAVLVEVPVMLAIAWFACRWVVQRLSVPATTAARLAMGALALTLLLVAEAGVSLALGRTLAKHFVTYRTATGLIGLTAQLIYAAFPLVQRRS